ncbi:MAG: hypothetical protein M0Q14_09970 [Tissierellaceae bacterium]|nr:hypothetical protein [Tissierellaceae bacterium]
MKKIYSVLLVFVLLMSISVVSFANGKNEVTFEEFEQLMKKYNLESVVVDIGTYVGIGDFSVRISLGQNDFSGTL